MMRKEILDSIKRHGPTMFLQLMGDVEGFVGDIDFRVGALDQNAILWGGMSEEAIAELRKFIDEGRVAYVPTVSGYYRYGLHAVVDEITKKEIDDTILSLPHANFKEIIDGVKYAELRWLPSVLIRRY